MPLIEEEKKGLAPGGLEHRTSRLQDRCSNHFPTTTTAHVLDGFDQHFYAVHTLKSEVPSTNVSNIKKSIKCGWHFTEVAFAHLTQLSRVWILGFFLLPCSWTVDRTHLVLMQAILQMQWVAKAYWPKHCKNNRIKAIWNSENRIFWVRCATVTSVLC